MLSAIATPLRQVAQSLLAFNTPNELAGGFAIGMIIGLVPKGNLIALSLCVLLFSLRCNKGLALLAAVAFTILGPWTDPFTHKLGALVLSYEPFQASYASVYQFPLGPWLGFNNTVVTGSLLLGLYIAYPVYWIVRCGCLVFATLATTPRSWPTAATATGGGP